MKKILTIAIKDLLVAFRDPASLIMMLVTPFALTLAIGFAFGGFDRSSSVGLSNIPVVIVNHDPREYGQQLVDIFQSEDLLDLLEPQVIALDSEARALVDQDQAAAAVIIPENFSESILPQAVLEGSFDPDLLENASAASIEVYVNPTRTVSSGIIQSIVRGFLNQLQAGVAGGRVSIEQLIRSGRLTPEEAAAMGELLGHQSGTDAASANLIDLDARIGEGGVSSSRFDWLAYTAPSMAIIFLMFTVANGGRSILAEKQWGTLPRLMVTPTRPGQVIGGKAAGIFITGLTQMSILILASYFLFRIQWGDPLAVVLLVIALALAASGWGILLAAFARSAGEANAAGNALSLVFAAAAGNFVPRMNLPDWLQKASLITPNAWGLDAFGALSGDGKLADILPHLGGLLVMTVVLVTLSALMFRRQYR